MEISYQGAGEVASLYTPPKKGSLYTATSKGIYKSTYIDTTFAIPNEQRTYKGCNKPTKVCTHYKRLQNRSILESEELGFEPRLLFRS